MELKEAFRAEEKLVAPTLERTIAEDDLIRDRDYAVIKVGQERNLFAQISKTSTVRISARDHHVKVADLIGQPFGAYFEFSRGTFTRIDKKPDPALLAPSADGEAKDNRNVIDTSENQNLTAEEIARLKAAGHSGESIIKALVSSLDSFESKTDYAKEKYIKKKQKKYITVVHVVRPTALSLCEAYFDKSPQKIFGLRPDSLSQLLTAANVRANSSVMVFEECSGLITGAVIEKLGGFGHVFNVQSGDEASIGIQQFFNFKNNESAVLTHLPVAKLKKILAGVDVGADVHSLDDIADEEKRARVAEKRALREQKRKETEDNVRRHCSEGIDALIIASRDDPLAVLEALFPFVALSGSIVLYSAYKEPLALCLHRLRAVGAAVQLQLSETWMREYQVLPKRTHPLMTMSGTGGYLLTAYKVRSEFGKGAVEAFEPSNRAADMDSEGECNEGEEPKRKKQRTRR